LYRLIKTENEKVEVLNASANEDRIIGFFKDYVFNSASNGDEYTPCDFEAIVEQGYERIGSYEISFDSVSEMTESDFLSRGGNVCIHCHSDDVEQGPLLMEDGYVSRDLTCNICDNVTTEQFTLAGYED